MTTTHKLTFFKTKKAAQAVIGSLSDTSKMPGKSWGISAHMCNTGAKMAKIDGSVCNDCYALKGSYKMYPAVAKAHATRIDAWQNAPQWRAAMIDLIGFESNFRWFDSGDLQSAGMLLDIFAIADSTPQTDHWIATREVAYVRAALKQREMPKNVVIRMSASFPDSPVVPGADLTGTIALVHKHDAPNSESYTCPAPSQGGKCADCRACWSKDVKAVSYKAH